MNKYNFKHGVTSLLARRRFNYVDFFSMAMFSLLIDHDNWPLAIVVLGAGTALSIWMERRLNDMEAG